MLKFLNNIKADFKLIFENYGFYVCVAFTMILCLCGNAYHDMLKNENYSVITILTQFDREMLLSDTRFCSYEIIQNVSGDWFSMFLPIISAFTFVPLICDERESKALRNVIFRTSKISFYASKFISACLAGGLAVFIGYSVFAGFACIAFPGAGQYSKELQSELMMQLEYIYADIPHSSFAFLTGLKLIEMFIYGAVCAIPAIFLTSIMKNKYLVLCIPFFAKYTLTQVCEKLMSNAWADIEHPDVLLGRMAKIFSPESVSKLFQSSDKQYILLYYGVLFVLLFAVYLVIQNRRLDCGE